MTRRRTNRPTALRFLCAVFAVALIPGMVAAQDGDSVEGSAEVGAWGASTSGLPDLVTEYEPDEGGPDLKLDLESAMDWGQLDLAAAIRSGEDYDLSLDFDVNRSLRSETAVTALLHRLVHESLDVFDAATVHGRVVEGDDRAPGQIYEIDYRLLEHRTEFQPRNASNLTLGFGLRHQEREGMRQSTTISHCDSCHVVSQNRPIDETTDDASFDAQVAWDKGRVGLSFTSREYEMDPTSISLLFDDALHPELRLPLFDNRLQYDSAEGPQPVDRVPDISKQIYRVDGDFPDVGGFYLAAEGVWSTTENDFTGLAADYAGYLVNAVRSFKENWRFRWSGRSYSLDNDDYFVLTNKRLGIAGPQAGRTYEEIYGFETDFLRQSALNRDVLESNLEFSRRFGREGRQRPVLLGERDDRSRALFRRAGGDREHDQRARSILARAAEEGLDDSSRLRARRDRRPVHAHERPVLDPHVALRAQSVPPRRRAVLRVPRRPDRRYHGVAGKLGRGDAAHELHQRQHHDGELVPMVGPGTTTTAI